MTTNSLKGNNNIDMSRQEEDFRKQAEMFADETVKCACWYLHEPVVPKHVNIPIDLAMKSIKLTSDV